MPGNADTVNALLAHAAWVADAGIRLIDRRMRDLWCPWRSIHEQASITAGGLTACGVRPGDRVAMVFPTGMEFLRVFFGALLVGAVPVPLCPPLRLGDAGCVCPVHRRDDEKRERSHGDDRWPFRLAFWAT